MADSFFGFDSKLPSLDGSKSFGLGGELGDDILDDDYDQLNDETFGGTTAELEGWAHEEHEQLVGEFSFGENGHGKHHLHNGGVLHEQDIKSSLEDSLSKLVVDDEDELEDPAVMNASKYRPIPKKHGVDLDNLFGPASPPGFLNTENLVSPGRTNIWGSPAREGMTQSRSLQEDSASKLLHMLQQQKASIASMQPPHQGPSVVFAGQPPGSSRLMESAERPASKPRAITVEELEREMRGEAPPPPPNQQRSASPAGFNFPPPIGTPMPPHIRQLPPGILRRSSTGQLGPVPGGFVMSGLSQSANAGLTRKPSPPPDAMAQMQALGLLRTLTPSPPLLMRRHSMTPSPPLSRTPSPVIPLPLPPFLLSSPHAQRLLLGILQSRSQNKPSPPTSSTTPGPPFMANSPVQQRPPFSGAMTDPIASRSHRGPGGQPPVGLKQSLFSSQRGRPHNQYHQQQYQDSHQQRYQDERYHERNQNSYGRGGRQGGYHQGNRRYSQEEDARAGGDHDEYANLMTQREKDWIIKIQLLQLHTDNPYVDDYYYTTWMMRKAMKEREKKVQDGLQTECHDTELQLLLPQLARAENRNYKPVQFEGSLGRLTASSVHNPRQIIDVAVNKDVSGEEAKTKIGRRFKRLLMEIEKCYALLLDIDDVEKQALALPEDGRSELFESRRQKIAQLFGLLSIHGHGPEPFKLMISVRKGLKLIARSLPVLDKGQLCVLLGDILRYLQPFMSKDPSTSECALLYSSVRQVLGLSSLEMLVYLVTAMQQGAEVPAQYLQEVLRNRFGASLIWALVSRGETIYSTVSPVDMEEEHHNAWVEFVKHIGESVRDIPVDELAMPLPGSLQVTRHMARLLDKKAYAAIEDHLQQVMGSVSS